jgi:transposase
VVLSWSGKNAILAVLCWHLLTKESDYLWARPAHQRGSAYAYNLKTLRTQEITIAEKAERAYEQFVSQWRPRGLGRGVRGRLKPARHE